MKIYIYQKIRKLGTPCNCSIYKIQSHLGQELSVLIFN